MLQETTRAGIVVAKTAPALDHGEVAGVRNARQVARVARSFLTASAAFLTGCGGETAKSVAWVDPSYKANPTVLVSLAIAPVPITGPLADRADQGIERAFLDTPGCQIRGQASFFRQRMNGDRKLVQTVNRILEETYTPEDLRAGAGLRRLLSEKELEDLRAVLNACNMLLVPTALEVRAGGSRTSGRLAFRVFDLATGKLLLQNAFERSVPAAGEAGERRVLVELILAVHQDFTAHLL